MNVFVRVTQRRSNQIKHGTDGTSGTSVVVPRQRPPDHLRSRPVLQADRRQDCRVARHGLDGTSTSAGNVDEYLGKFTGVEEAKTGGVMMTCVFKINQVMLPSLCQPPSPVQDVIRKQS